MAQVRWTLGAVLDLEEISGYLSRTSDNYASELLKASSMQLRVWKRFPEWGALYPKIEWNDFEN